MWKCPYCKLEHNRTAQWIIHNGRKVQGFCSDECVNAYRAKYPETKKKSGLGGLLLKGINDVLTGFGN